MLRVAVPNKGALSEPATEILAEAGYRRRTDSKDLTVIDPVNNVEFFFLRPKDIAIYVGSGELDYSPDRDELLRFEKTLMAIWRAIQSAGETGDFRPNPSRLCDWCPHQQRCPAFGGTPPPYPGWPTEPAA